MQTIWERYLISADLADFTRAMLRVDPVLDVYLHVPGGAAQIGGGEFGVQVIQCLPMTPADVGFIQSAVRELDLRLELDYRFCDAPEQSDIAIYFYSEIDLGDASTTLGLAIPNLIGGKRHWEILINYQAFGSDRDYLLYAIIHELAHAHGLEHPFDRTDGDLFNGTSDPWKSAYPEDTVMAYRTPRLGAWPHAYTENDWRALVSLWGVESQDTNLAPSAIYLSLVPLVEGITAGLAIATLSSNDPNANDQHVYTLIAGQGDRDNAHFRIEGNQLLILESPDYERQASYQIRLQTTDQSGLSFAMSLTLQVVDLDEDPPLAPRGLMLEPLSDSGADSGDGITSVTKPSFCGWAEASAAVQLFNADDPDRRLLGVAKAGLDGRWTLNLATPLADGHYRLVAMAIDATGNRSPESAVLAITVDRQPPQIVVHSDQVGASADSGQLLAWIEVNEPVEWSITGGDDAIVFQLTPEGNLFLRNGTMQAEGVQHLDLLVTAIDRAGNSSECILALIIMPSLIQLPRSVVGSQFRLSSHPQGVATVRSLGDPDYILIDRPVTMTVQLRTAELWGQGFAARNVQTGQLISLDGLGRYAVVVWSHADAVTTLELDPVVDSALFLHDSYSRFPAQLAPELLLPDSTGRASVARFPHLSTIVMGDANGTSLVDLTSVDYITGGVTVLGGTQPQSRSVFWGGSGDDTFVARGADSLIFAGAGANTLVLSTGRDVLQYTADGQARDTIPFSEDFKQWQGFDPALDSIELWEGDRYSPPVLKSAAGGCELIWGENRLLFQGISDLSLNQLNLVWR